MEPCIPLSAVRKPAMNTLALADILCQMDRRVDFRARYARRVSSALGRGSKLRQDHATRGKRSGAVKIGWHRRSVTTGRSSPGVRTCNWRIAEVLVEGTTSRRSLAERVDIARFAVNSLIPARELRVSVGRDFHNLLLKYLSRPPWVQFAAGLPRLQSNLVLVQIGSRRCE